MGIANRKSEFIHFQNTIIYNVQYVMDFSFMYNFHHKIVFLSDGHMLLRSTHRTGFWKIIMFVGALTKVDIHTFCFSLFIFRHSRPGTVYPSISIMLYSSGWWVWSTNHCTARVNPPLPLVCSIYTGLRCSLRTALNSSASTTLMRNYSNNSIR